MFEPITRRAKHGLSLWREGLWGKWISSIYAIATAYVFIRDDFWRPPKTDGWALVNMIPHLSLAWWIAGGLGVLCFWLFEASFRAAGKLKSEIDTLRLKYPLEIIFDTSNPHNRFWKTVVKQHEGYQPSTVMEYRVGVRNNSTKTIRNVRVFGDTRGLSPEDPTDMTFQRDSSKAMDIQPGRMELVSVAWVYPPRAGDFAGETASQHLGPLGIIVTGDDVGPSEKIFEYMAEQIPALMPRSSI